MVQPTETVEDLAQQVVQNIMDKAKTGAFWTHSTDPLAQQLPEYFNSLGVSFPNVTPYYYSGFRTENEEHVVETSDMSYKEQISVHTNQQEHPRYDFRLIGDTVPKVSKTAPSTLKGFYTPGSGESDTSSEVVYIVEWQSLGDYLSTATYLQNLPEGYVNELGTMMKSEHDKELARLNKAVKSTKFKTLESQYDGLMHIGIYNHSKARTDVYYDQEDMQFYIYDSFRVNMFELNEALNWNYYTKDPYLRYGSESSYDLHEEHFFANSNSLGVSATIISNN